MKTMMTILAVALLARSMATSAAPQAFDLVFDGGTNGPPGTGAFVWDSATGTMTDFTWDFAGVTGGVTDTALAWNVFGGSLGACIYKVLTGISTYTDCQGGQIGLFNTPYATPVYGPFANAIFFGPLRLDAPNVYTLNNDQYRGHFAVLPRALAMIRKLLAEVTGVGPGRSLSDKMTLVQTYYAANDIPATCSMLTDLVSEIRAQSGKTITTELAATLTTEAQAIMAEIGCN